MRWLGSLGVGEWFKVAGCEVYDMLNRKHPPGIAYKVVKVYPQKPFVRVAVSASLTGPASFLPGMVVYDPKEPTPDGEAIRRFLEPKLHRTVVGYELLWDGHSGKALELSPRVRGLLEAWLTTTPRITEKSVLYNALNEYYDDFCEQTLTTLPSKVLQQYSRRLSDMGLIKVLYAEDDYGRSNERVKRSEAVLS